MQRRNGKIWRHCERYGALKEDVDGVASGNSDGTALDFFLIGNPSNLIGTCEKTCSLNTLLLEVSLHSLQKNQEESPFLCHVAHEAVRNLDKENHIMLIWGEGVLRGRPEGEKYPEYNFTGNPSAALSSLLGCSFALPPPLAALWKLPLAPLCCQVVTTSEGWVWSWGELREGPYPSTQLGGWTVQRGKVPSDVAVFQGNGISPMTPWWLNSVRDVAAFGVFIIYQQAQSEVVLLAFFFFFPFLPSFPPILSSRFLGYLGCVQVILCPLPFELTSLCSAGASQPLRLEDKKWNTFPSRNGCKTGQESPPIRNLFGVWVFHARTWFAIIETPQRGTY